MKDDDNNVKKQYVIFINYTVCSPAENDFVLQYFFVLKVFVLFERFIIYSLVKRVRKTSGYNIQTS